MSEPVGYKLYKLVKKASRNPSCWEQVLARALSHPEEARFVDFFYFCPLGLACESNVPLEVFNALYEAAPDMINPKPNHTILHHAVNGSSVEIVKRILEIHLPMAFHVDHNGSTAFEKVVREKIHVAFTPNFDPNKYWSWETACLLLKVFYYKTIEDELPGGKQWRVLHVAVACTKQIRSFRFKMEMIQLAIQKHPEQLSQRDEDGNLPLHIACEVEGLGSDGRVNAIKMLVEAYPEAATMRNARGDLPLHLALRNGKRMGVRELAKANMDALMESDTQTGLFPFQAASASRRRNDDLSITYELLRGCPQLHSFGNWATLGVPEKKKKSGSKKRKASSKGSSSRGKKKK